MGFWSRLTLNEERISQGVTKEPIDVALTLAMADLKARFIDVDRGTVRYGSIRGSEEFEHYRELASRLRSFDLESLVNRDQRLSFWINIYNTLVIHGVVELGLERSVREVSRFFDRVEYEIGGHRFSLNDIEHGILRGNQRPPYKLLRPFRGRDPRWEFAVRPMDPRIHFALVCGARSCPPIGFYEADQIDFQLDLAAASFINSPQVQVFPEERAISISMIFKWYKGDFGGTDGALVETVLKFLDEGEKKDFLKHHRERVRIRYQPYDWRLNKE